MTATGTARTMNDERGFPMRGLALQAALEFRLLLRSPESFLITLGLPVGLLAFLGTVDIFPTGDGDPVEFLVPGVIAVSVMATGLVASSIQTAFERQYGVLKLLGATPLPRGGYIAAKGVAAFGLLCIQLVLVLIVAVGLLGWTPSAGVVPLTIGVLVGAVAFTAIGQLLAGALPAMLCLAFANALFAVLTALGGLVLSLDAFPAAVASAAELLPSGALGQVLRAAMDPEPSLAVGSLLVVAGWGLVAVVAASRTFRWEPEG